MINVYILPCSVDIKIWGLSPHSRLIRTFKKKGGVKIVEDINSISSPEERVILIDANYVYDDRVINYLINTKNVAIDIGKDGKEIVAVNTTRDYAERCLDAIKNNDDNLLPEQLMRVNLCDIDKSSFQKLLRKSEKPFILNIKTTPVKDIEERLYASSYKGVTDIVTRLIWPKPAKAAVRFCVKKNITPNQVTTLSLILAVVAGLLFYKNFYIIGLITGWFMTFLDTVDGKLARVTVNYSTFGNAYDHSIDILHPPYWYICWGLSLANFDVSTKVIWFTIYIIIIFYILGRVVEGAFRPLTNAKFSIYCWEPFDSFFRLVTARRNPNMIILTICALLFKAYALGLYLVAVWTVISTVILTIRLINAVKEKKEKGFISSWLENVDPKLYNKKIYKLFINQG